MKKNYLLVKQKIWMTLSVTFIILLTTFNVNAQYCIPIYDNPCSSNDVITNFTIGTINNPSGCSNGNYADYTALPTPTLYLGVNYQASISTIFGSAGVSIWIDFNDDFSFDPSERVATTSTYIGANSTGSVSVHLPITSNSGVHRLRARLIYNDLGTNVDPCTNYGYGEAEDYLVNLIPLPSCSGAPVAGNSISTLTLACTNTAFDLNLTNNNLSSGLTYQWQSSPNGSTWTNLGTPQLSSSNTISSLTANTYYQCVVTCTNTTLSSTSTPILVTLNPLMNCYCTPSYSLICAGDNIGNFSIANVNLQTTNCDVSGYTDSTSAFTAINLTAGSTYTLQAYINNGGNSNGGDMAAGVWIDYNQNAQFETSEFTSLGFGGAQTYSNTIHVPINAPTNSVRMRLKVDAYYSDATTVLDACSNNNGSTYGQIIDYKVNINAAPACSGIPNPGGAISTETAVCENKSFILNLTNNSIASNITYQWQSSTNNMTWLNLGGLQSSIPYTIPTQSTTTYYRCISTCTTSAPTSSASTSVLVNQNLANTCYCIPDYINCSIASIYNLSFGTLNDAPTCNQSSGYNDNTSTIASVSLTANQSYTISAEINTGSNTSYAGCWIDYNQNGIFEYYEYTDLGNTTLTNTLTNTINVPYSAVGGNTRMRVKVEGTYSTFSGLNPCSAFAYDGQTLDYIVTITAATPCSLTPNAGDATTSVSSICENKPFTLNLTNNSIASNISYQWQSSTNNINWTNLGTLQSFVTHPVLSQSITTFYRCLTTCLSSAITSTSTVWTITQNSDTACYCIPDPMDCTGNSLINSVTLATLTNTSSCGTDGYSNYTTSVASPTVTTGQTYTITTVLGDTYGQHTHVWVDFNKDGEFDSNEYTDIGPSNNTSDTISSTIIIPSNAFTGVTRMRVRNISGFSLDALDACNTPTYNPKSPTASFDPMSLTYGETEDYSITIENPDCSTLFSNPTSYSVSAITSPICAGETVSLSITPNLPAAIGFSYNWYTAPSTGTYGSIGANSASVISTPSTTSYYYSEILCNGSAYKITNTVTINVNPSSDISGIVTTHSNTTTPVVGRVVLYKYLPFYTKFDSVAGQNIGVTGDYNFTSFSAGTYIVKAIPTSNNLQIAYGDSAVNWKTAKQIIHGCAVNDIQNINVQALQTFVPGPGVLTGIITQTIGYGQKAFGSSNENNNAFKPMVPGQPIGGIIVKGGRNPGGQMFTQTITSTDSITPGVLGTYTLSGLPYGDYFILVDIAGLDTNNTYHVQINANNTVFNNLDFTVDSIQINPINSSAVGTREINSIESKINMYPNPASNFVTIQYDLKSNAIVKIELFDILGKSVKTLLPQTQQSKDNYKTSWQLDEITSGLYFIKITINGSDSIIKLSVTN